MILATSLCSAVCWGRCEYPTLTQLCSVLSPLQPASAKGHHSLVMTCQDRPVPSAVSLPSTGKVKEREGQPRAGSSVCRTCCFEHLTGAKAKDGAAGPGPCQHQGLAVAVAMHLSHPSSSLSAAGLHQPSLNALAPFLAGHRTVGLSLTCIISFALLAVQPPC